MLKVLRPWLVLLVVVRFNMIEKYEVTYTDDTLPRLFDTAEEAFAEWIKGGNRYSFKKVLIEDESNLHLDA